MLKIQTSVPDVVIPNMHKDLIAWLRSINVNTVPKLDTSQRCALPKILQYYRGKPKQAHQIVVPQHYNKPYQNTQECDNDDEFMIAFQLCAQPQRSIHNQRVNTSYAQKHLYANILYQLKPYHNHNQYLCVQLNMCTDVNLMPESVYKLVFNDLQTATLAKNDIDLTVYTRHSVDLIGKCTFYMLSKATKQPIKVEFYVAKEEGSVFLSQETIFQLQLPDVKPRLEYLPPPEQCSYPVQLIIPKERYMHNLQHLSFPLLHLQYPRKTHQGESKFVKSKEQIQEQYPELF